MFNRIACIFFTLLFNITSFAQKDFARKIVDTLASPYMGGRGYVDNGNKRAADYLIHNLRVWFAIKFWKLLRTKI